MPSQPSESVLMSCLNYCFFPKMERFSCGGKWVSIWTFFLFLFNPWSHAKFLKYIFFYEKVYAYIYLELDYSCCFFLEIDESHGDLGVL